MIEFNLVQKRKGNLILIGGAEDRKEDKIVLKRMIEFCNAKNIILIPSASSYPREVAETYETAFKDLGVTNFHVFDVRSHEEADNPMFFHQLEQADLIFISGGDQVKLVEAFEGSELIKRIKQKFLEEGLHIGGTSAGAACVSDPMIYDGDYEGFEKGTVNFSKGFGYLKDITIDTHFVARSRVGRLSQFLLSGDIKKGIGIGEDTGVLISPDMKFEVVGSGIVTLVDTEKVTYSNYDKVVEFEMFSANNLKVGFLAKNTKFDIKKWKVII